MSDPLAQLQQTQTPVTCGYQMNTFFKEQNVPWEEHEQPQESPSRHEPSPQQNLLNQQDGTVTIQTQLNSHEGSFAAQKYLPAQNNEQVSGSYYLEYHQEDPEDTSARIILSS